jgi:hypothetical protein
VLDASVLDGVVLGVLVTPVDGVVMDGVVADGVVTDGVVTDGVVLDGIVLDGVVTEGVVTDGVVTDDGAVDGVVGSAMLPFDEFVVTPLFFDVSDGVVLGWVELGWLVVLCAAAGTASAVRNTAAIVYRCFMILFAPTV